MTELAQTTDSWGRTVRLMRTGWNHILGDHDELVDLQEDILMSIERPDRVVWDATHANRENFYRIVADHDKPRPLYLKVCVEYSASGGTIVTAYPLRRIKRRERQRWP